VTQRRSAEAITHPSQWAAEEPSQNKSPSSQNIDQHHITKNDLSASALTNQHATTMDDYQQHSATTKSTMKKTQSVDFSRIRNALRRPSSCEAASQFSRRAARGSYSNL